MPPPAPRRPLPTVLPKTGLPGARVDRKNCSSCSVGFLLSPSRIKLAHCSHLTSVRARVQQGEGGGASRASFPPAWASPTAN